MQIVCAKETQMTKKEVDMILMFGNSHTYPFEDRLIGVTKFQAFLAIRYLLKGKLYWYALRNAYEMSDNLYSYRYDIRLVFKSEEPEREYLMNKKERDYLRDLPNQFTIYRGMTESELKSNVFGISWTLKKERAEYFINTYIRNYATNHFKKVVHKLVIDKKDAIAFFNGRKEFEIIYFQPNIKESWQQ
jgi:hypothetical protein